MAVSTYSCSYLGKLLPADFSLPPYLFALKMHIWRVPYSNFFLQFILAGSGIFAFRMARTSIFGPIKKLKIHKIQSKSTGPTMYQKIGFGELLPSSFSRIPTPIVTKSASLERWSSKLFFSIFNHTRTQVTTSG